MFKQEDYTIWVNGAERARLRDAYHTFLRLGWAASLALIGVGFFFVNLVFTVAYMIVGGVDGVAKGSFFDALMFSVETLGTIGYGVMHPVAPGANVVVILESITGIIITALITGLVFSKFARANARIAFSDCAVVCSHEGKPTLMFRTGNERSNAIIEARMHLVCSVRTTDDKGKPFYKLTDLKLVRDRMGAMRRGWLVMHVIDETSPLYGMQDTEALVKNEVELDVAVMGFDDVTLQTVYAMHVYPDKKILFKRRLVDTLVVYDNGDLLFDITKFHLTEPE